jgi:hypothetical protein
MEEGCTVCLILRPGSILSGRILFQGDNYNMKFPIKKLVLLAMLAAVAYLIVSVIRIPVVLFLSYEPKDVVITIGGFLLGPMASFIIPPTMPPTAPPTPAIVPKPTPILVNSPMASFLATSVATSKPRS